MTLRWWSLVWLGMGGAAIAQGRYTDRFLDVALPTWAVRVDMVRVPFGTLALEMERALGKSLWSLRCGGMISYFPREVQIFNRGAGWGWGVFAGVNYYLFFTGTMGVYTTMEGMYRRYDMGPIGPSNTDLWAARVVTGWGVMLYVSKISISAMVGSGVRWARYVHSRSNAKWALMRQVDYSGVIYTVTLSVGVAAPILQP